MPPLNLEPIRKREQAATLGPWKAKPCANPEKCDGISPDYHNHGPDQGCWESNNYNCPATDEIVTTDSGYYGPLWPDAEFIAHARSDVPALLAEVEALRSQRADLVATLKSLMNESSALFFSEAGLRAVIGNTNATCLRERIDQARAAIAKAEE